MIITVFGANGRTGSYVIRKAIEAGHTVRAAVRNPETFRASLDDTQKLEIVEADVLNSDQVSSAVSGADAVVSVIGLKKGSEKNTLGRGGENIVEALCRHGVRRIIVLTGAGVRFPQDKPGFIDRVIRFLLKTLQPEVLEDSIRYTKTVTEGDLDWTVVRAPMLHDKPAPGPYRVGYVGKGPGPRASRENIAKFIVDALSNNDYIRDAPMVSD